jgi:hypothetical protein
VRTSGNSERPPLGDDVPRTTAFHSWRWRESNPRPSAPSQGFSGCSPWCRSTRPRRLHEHIVDRPSHENVPLGPRGLIRAVSHLADAGPRADDELRPTESQSLRQRERTQCAWNWHLNLRECRINEVTDTTLDPLPLERLPKSKPITPCEVVKTTWTRGPGGRHASANTRVSVTLPVEQHGDQADSRHGEGIEIDPGTGRNPREADTREVDAAHGGGRQGRADLQTGRISPEMRSCLIELVRYPLSRAQSPGKTLARP